MMRARGARARPRHHITREGLCRALDRGSGQGVGPRFKVAFIFFNAGRACFGTVGGVGAVVHCVVGRGVDGAGGHCCGEGEGCFKDLTMSLQ